MSAPSLIRSVGPAGFFVRFAMKPKARFVGFFFVLALRAVGAGVMTPVSTVAPAATLDIAGSTAFVVAGAPNWVSCVAAKYSLTPAVGAAKPRGVCAKHSLLLAAAAGELRSVGAKYSLTPTVDAGEARGVGAKYSLTPTVGAGETRGVGARYSLPPTIGAGEAVGDK